MHIFADSYFVSSLKITLLKETHMYLCTIVLGGITDTKNIDSPGKVKLLSFLAYFRENPNICNYITFHTMYHQPGKDCFKKKYLGADQIL